MENLRYFDLYPSSVIFEQLKQKFNHCSFCKKSVPSLGSACYKINKLNSNCGAKIYATKNGFDTISVRYNCGYNVAIVAKKEGKKWVSK